LGKNVVGEFHEDPGPVLLGRFALVGHSSLPFVLWSTLPVSVVVSLLSTQAGGLGFKAVDISYPGFGTIVIEGMRFDHDVVVEGGRVRPRDKKPSKKHKSTFHHTPLSLDEEIPWSPPRLVVGTGASGRLPVMPEVWAEAARRSIELITVPTAEACLALRDVDQGDVYAILHVTC
jgi:hypothetical protein